MLQFDNTTNNLLHIRAIIEPAKVIVIHEVKDILSCEILTVEDLFNFIGIAYNWLSRHDINADDFSDCNQIKLIDVRLSRKSTVIRYPKISNEVLPDLLNQRRIVRLFTHRADDDIPKYGNVLAIKAAIHTKICNECTSIQQPGLLSVKKLADKRLKSTKLFISFP